MGEVPVNNCGLILHSQKDASTHFNTLGEKEIGRKTKSVKTASHHSKNKTDTRCHRSKAPYTLQQRTQVTDPGSVVYIDIAMSSNGQ